MRLAFVNGDVHWGKKESSGWLHFKDFPARSYSDSGVQGASAMGSDIAFTREVDGSGIVVALVMSDGTKLFRDGVAPA